MRTMLGVKKGKRSKMNRSRPRIKPDHRARDQKAVPFKKRARFLCLDDTRQVCQSENIGPSDDRRVRSRSDVANTGESKKTEIAHMEKKLSNTANDEVTYASVSPVAIRSSEVPLATSASEEDHVKERERAKTPAINAPSEPQGVFVVDGGIKQVDTLKEVTEHEGHDGGESTKSGPQGDGGNNDGVVIDEKLINQTKDVIQQEGGDDGITGEPQVDGIEADEYKEVMEDGGNENDSNNARDDVNKLLQPEPVTNLDGSSSQSCADTTIKGNNICKETEGGAEATKGKEPVDDVVSTMLVYSGHELVKTALDRVDHGSGGINEAGGAFETTKSKELDDDFVSTMVVDGWPDWDENTLNLVDYCSGSINNYTGGESETSKGKEPVDDVVSTMVVDGGRDWEENALNKGKEPVDDVVSAMVVEGGDDWERNALNHADYGSGGINEIGSEVETSAGKEPIDGGWYEWAGNKLDVADYESGGIDVTIGEFETSNVNEKVNDGVSTGVGGWHDWEKDAPDYKSRGINVIPMIHQRHLISARPSDYTVSEVAVNDGNTDSGKQEPEDPYSPIVTHGAPLNPANPTAIPEGGSGGIEVPLTEEHQRNYNRPIEYIVIESSDSEPALGDPYSPIVGHGAPLNPAYPIPNPEGGSGGGGGPRGGSLSDQTADRGLYAHAQRVIDIPMSQFPMTITSFKKESTNSGHDLHEGSQDGGSGEAEQNANRTVRFRGCQKHTAATNTKDGDASGGAAADGSPPMRDSDVLRQQVHPASTGTGDGARNKSQEPLADDRGESSMRRPKAGLRLLGFDI